MDEDINYVTVTFKNNNVSTQEKLNNLESIYAEIKTEQMCDTVSVLAEKKKTPPLCPLPTLVKSGSLLIGVVLVSVLVVLVVLLNGEMVHMKEENLQLLTEKSALETKTEELKRERDQLHWTVEVIMTYDSFPVSTLCPEKVCKPCPDGWVLFQSHCYTFSDQKYSSSWKTWQGSRDSCRQRRADLVVIDSPEEQEFINNHTVDYNDENHGYWLGLSNMDAVGSWSWVDGSNVTMTFWRTQQKGYSVSCASSLPRADPQANWNKASCDMRNRWICETKALITSD